MAKGDTCACATPSCSAASPTPSRSASASTSFLNSGAYRLRDAPPFFVTRVMIYLRRPVYWLNGVSDVRGQDQNSIGANILRVPCRISAPRPISHFLVTIPSTSSCQTTDLEARKRDTFPVRNCGAQMC